MKDNVFHLTPQSSLDSIMLDGFINNNHDGHDKQNTASPKKAMVEIVGYVCLFDFRNASSDEIESTRSKYDFITPSWFSGINDDNYYWELRYLFLKSSLYNDLIPNENAMKALKSGETNTYYVPNTECWYPGKILLSCIAMIIKVSIIKQMGELEKALYRTRVGL